MKDVTIVVIDDEDDILELLKISLCEEIHF